MTLSPSKSPDTVRRLRAFWRDESGASTVEWVILAASCLSLSIGLSTLVNGGVERSAKNTASALDDYVIASSFDGGASGGGKDDDAGGKTPRPSGGVSPGVLPAGAPAPGSSGASEMIGAVGN